MAARAPTTRRDFLRGRSLGDTVSDWAGRRTGAAVRGPEGTNSSTELGTASLITASRRAMACHFEIVLPATTPAAVPAASAALDEIDRLEEQMTAYRDTSELSRINMLAAVMPVRVEERLFELFETALWLTAETDGAFDMAAGALVKAWGFFRGPKRVPEPAELADVLARVGSQHITLDRACRTIEFRRPGLELNLGAIGKGYALDRAAELLRRDWNISSAILHGGRSSVYAIGSTPERGLGQADTHLSCEPRRGPGRPDAPVTSSDPFSDAGDEGGWLVGIAHPLQPAERVATIVLCDEALGTSGGTIQYFEANGRRFAHILDPRTGWPAEGHICVSVIAPTAAAADALSTAFFILGLERARDYCDRHPAIGALVVSDVGSEGRLQATVLGRAKDRVELEIAPFH